MRVAVFGPGIYKRQPYDNYEYVASKLDDVALRYQPSLVHTGGGKGVEQLALRWAAVNDVEAKVTPPNIQRDGIENAFVIRNREILEDTDLVILLWDTADAKYAKMLKDCATRLLPVVLFGVE